jgi:hypothetical protein
MELVYVGPHDEVEVQPFPGADHEGAVWPVVKHGDTYDFPDDLGKRLLEQPSNWQPTLPDKAAKPSGAKPASEKE